MKILQSVICFGVIFLGKVDYAQGALEAVDYDKLSILAPCLLDLSEKYFSLGQASRGSLVVINLVPNPRSFLQRKILEAINEDNKHALGVMVKDGRLKHLNASAWYLKF
jgi:hypothetical protein